MLPKTKISMEDQNDNGKFSKQLRKMKPYLAILSLQFGYSGMYIITMVSFKHGMSHWILSVYRHVVAAIIITPFAFVLERYLSLFFLSILKSLFVNVELAIKKITLISNLDVFNTQPRWIFLFICNLC